MANGTGRRGGSHPPVAGEQRVAVAIARWSVRRLGPPTRLLSRSSSHRLWPARMPATSVNRRILTTD